MVDAELQKDHDDECHSAQSRDRVGCDLECGDMAQGPVGFRYLSFQLRIWTTMGYL